MCIMHPVAASRTRVQMRRLSSKKRRVQMSTPQASHAPEDGQARKPDVDRGADAADVTPDSKHNQILAGARQIFRAEGFDAASMDGIARAARVSKGTLYVYFSSKEGLFADLVRADLKAAAEQHAVLDHDNPDVRAVLHAYGISFLRRMLEPEHIAMVRMVIAASIKQPALGQIFYEAGPEHGVRKLSSYLSEQAAHGQLVTPDPDLAASQFYELCQGNVVKPLFFGAPSDTSEASVSRTIENALDIFLGHYGAPGA